MILTKETIKNFNLDNFINEHIAQDKLFSLLIIVPTNRKLRALKKELIKRSNSQVVSQIYIETLTTLTTKILKRSNHFLQLTDAAANVFLKKSCNNLSLNYFSGYKGEIPFGTLERLKNVISEYKKTGITPELLRFESNALDAVEKLKAIDIANIYEEYAKITRELNSLEIGDIYHNLIKNGFEIFETNFGLIYPQVKSLVALGFDYFTPPEIEILYFLSELKSSRVFINLDFYRYNPLIFSHIDSCYQKLTEIGFTAIQETAISYNDEFNSIIRQKLFSNNVAEPIEYKGKNLFKIIGDSREKEVELITASVKTLISFKNTAPNQICVCFNLIDNYSNLIQNSFAEAGIPFNLTDRYRLSNSMPIIWLLNLLQVAESNYHIKNIVKAFGGGIFSNLGIDANNLLQIASSVGIISGFDNWVGKISNVRKLENSSKIDYTKGLFDINKIHSLLNKFRVKLTLIEFKANLFELINEIKIYEKLLESPENLRERNIKALTVFIETLTELFELITIEKGDDCKFELANLIEQIKTACSGTRYNVKEKSEYGILITSINEIRGLKFEHLFIGGLADKDFPTSYKPEIFFSGKYIKKEIMHQTEERYHFYQTLNCFNKSLFLSTPATCAEKELQESSFLKDFEKVFVVKPITESNFSSYLFSKSAVLKNSNLPSSKKFLAENNSQLSIFNGLKPTENPSIINITEFENSSETNFSSLISRREYSVTKLEVFSKCPFKYFVEGILALQPIEEPIDELKAAETGSILHDIFYQFYTEITQQKLDIKNADEPTFNSALELLNKIAENVFADSKIDTKFTFLEKEKIFGINGNKKNSLLYRFLETEKDDSTGFIPYLFEKKFTDLLIENDGKSISLHGKIDRIDVNENDSEFTVVDYKLSGDKPTEKELANGYSLQLPVYMLAAKKILKEIYNKNFEADSSMIYSLKFNKKEFGKTKLLAQKMKSNDKYSVNNSLISNAQNKIIELYNKMTNGEFETTSAENREKLICGYCDLSTICRVEEEKRKLASIPASDGDSSDI